MKVPFYLVVNSSGSVRTLKSQPSLNYDEVSVYMQLDIPDGLFKKPVLSAKITIPESVVMESPIDATVAENVKDAVEQATGLKFAITVEKDIKENQK